MKEIWQDPMVLNTSRATAHPTDLEDPAVIIVLYGSVTCGCISSHTRMDIRINAFRNVYQIIDRRILRWTVYDFLAVFRHLLLI